MKLLNKDNKKRVNNLIDWLLHMFFYTIAFILVTSLFDTIYVEKDNVIIWSSIIVFVIYILNKTIKPVLVTLTIPITGITIGLFYPFINVMILKLTDWILGKYFEVNNILVAVLFAILLSTSNFVANEIIKKVMYKVKRR